MHPPCVPITRLTQDAVGRDGASTPGAVGPLGLDCELPLLAGAHVEQALVPALDDLAGTDGEGQGLAAVV
jgi:hypothetical protein